MRADMKILVPLNNERDVERYAAAGADQFYFGFFDPEWTGRFSHNADINRMSAFGTRANRFSFENALGVIRQIASLGKDSYVTFNANVYSEEQIEFIGELFFELKEAGVTGVILSDATLVSKALSAGIDAVASTMTAIYNTDILKYYAGKGFKRVIVPRECSISDIKTMHDAFPDIEIEAFYMRNGCLYSDCNCLIDHHFGGLCTDLRRRQGLLSLSPGHSVDEAKLRESLKLFDEKLFSGIACGHCALYDLYHAGVKALKIVGRADRNDSVLKDIETTERNLEVVFEASSKEEYLSNMIKPDAYCVSGLNCYYRG